MNEAAEADREEREDFEVMGIADVGGRCWAEWPAGLAGVYWVKEKGLCSDSGTGTVFHARSFSAPIGEGVERRGRAWIKGESCSPM